MPDSTTSAQSPTPRWRDPLFSPGDRFPLGAPDGAWLDGEQGPSSSGVRPFSLRGVVTGPSIIGSVGASYGYCPVRQVALVDGEPMLRHTKPGPTPVTSGTSDGQPGKPPPEEMASPDYQSD